MNPYKEDLKKAVSFFWKTREAQGNKQGKETGVKDYGNRSLVTGGAQLNGFIELFAKIARDSGLEDSAIITKETTLPGYFRPTKEWDLLLISEKQLIASIEFKSHVGPSFGNNFNNRVEEALGTATDILTAYRNGVFGSQPKPWTGYFLLLESHPKSLSPVKNREPYFKTSKEFHNASYADRYKEFCKRLVRERLYDSSCLLIASSDQGRKGIFEEVDAEINSNTFIASLIGRITAYKEKRKFDL
ncbi:PaeR7I family type II restriction endonuclease [Leptospira yasudae]|uniref:PaeR7I family type II restriction endonuclease n=1 Tax=Leptospira yasudae TaxID=2202201 RepID=UPI001090BEFF|nr:PaeR7I family type II restriction endonuclease [Leptospira yasudae]TGM95972.1 restriction endonuclease [Leptospira yasudae]